MPELATYSARESASSLRPRALALSPTDNLLNLQRSFSGCGGPGPWDPQQQHDEFLGLEKWQDHVGSGGEAFWRGTLGFVFLCLGWLFSRFLVWEVKEVRPTSNGLFEDGA